ncbi:uracil-DNA glycosylase superfamily protein [Syntrophotalea carbinolica DSM 2380]|uniref:Type-5 uracil-DNA glycosylase n=1 Tax=Syntrophotalea carbinolica (strain DSM 2380 / NBRC 103641 / GraBd1) TaxID=338963 RepID=Q3A6L2_SYNC1|nr:uracil-DNA glycosylase [Syntrophotalea carbinolica]ABA87995.1 uracil-DNA glycosylase superfamily protein [Syntrophotalea carbinolica DSM 2380]
MTHYTLENIASCRRCQRLVDYIADLPPAKGRRRSEYWNRPVPGFGDLQARIFLVGLAPGAHGANRTGRPFTGDGAGDFMYPLLHEAGFASQAEAVSSDDGLELYDLYISNAVKCVPPQNKPLAAEFHLCRPFLTAELKRLTNLKVVVALGRAAFDSYMRLCVEQGHIQRMAEFPFAHGASYLLPHGIWVVACYHTSRYNVNTGRMTQRMFADLLIQIRELAENG